MFSSFEKFSSCSSMFSSFEKPSGQAGRPQIMRSANKKRRSLLGYALSSVCVKAKHWKTIKGTGLDLLQSVYVHVESRNVKICLTCNITFWVEGVPRRGYSSKKWKHKFSVNQCRLHILLSHATVNVQLQRTMGKDVIFHVSWWETLYAMCLFSLAFAFNVFFLIPMDIVDDYTHSS